MSAVAFDTLKAKKTLTGVGVEEEVAEAFVAVAGDAVPEDVATKGDVDNLKTVIEATIERDIARLEVRMILTMVGIAIAASGTTIAALSSILGN